MSEEMDVTQTVGPGGDNRKASVESNGMDLEPESIHSAKNGSYQGIDTVDSSIKTSKNIESDNLLKLDIQAKEKSHCNGKNCIDELSKAQNSNENGLDGDCKLSPPVFVNSQPFQQNILNDCPFQKPTVCRTHSVGSGDPSPFAIRRRPGKLAFPNQLRSPSAFKRKTRTHSPLRFHDGMEDNDLKRCNSAPMLNEFNELEARLPWHQGSITPGSVRARRFSATVLSSPTSGNARSTSRLHQLKKEESLEGIQYKETAHEREVQTSILMNNTCEELSLADVRPISISVTGDNSSIQSTLEQGIPRSPLPSSITSVSIPALNKPCPTRAIDFTTSNPPHHSHQLSGGSIPSPLTISTGPLSLSPLPPSPTRNIGFSSSVGKQCFSPSMQVQLPAQYLRPGSLSPSPSPTRRTFVTRRRSQSPCVLKPSALGSIKRKCDSDSEGGSSPKRMYMNGIQQNQNSYIQNQGESFQHYSVIPLFTRSSIHRSHSLSSSSMDSDPNVSPSPPQPGANIGFLPTSHPLGISNHSRDGNNGYPFQSPLHPFANTGNSQDVTRCSSPASSTCSSSSLEGLKDLPSFTQNHLASQPTNNSYAPTLKPPVKDFQPPGGASTNVSSTNVPL